MTSSRSACHSPFDFFMLVKHFCGSEDSVARVTSHEVAPRPFTVFYTSLHVMYTAVMSDYWGVKPEV
ncbi:hypothetical protein BaRGS_00024702, partial [Batillaria attramentaria]